MNVRAQSAASAIAGKPPFRAEHIGSLLRPAKLLRERARFAKGGINAAELAAAEDDAIAEASRRCPVTQASASRKPISRSRTV